MIRAHLLIQGMVQGVGYRANTRRRANRLNLRGWVRNLRNGDVEIIVEGPEVEVDRLIAWCHRGPTSAYVSKVRVEKTKATNKFDGFAVKRTL
jgi:acylphosphatase